MFRSSNLLTSALTEMAVVELPADEQALHPRALELASSYYREFHVTCEAAPGRTGKCRSTSCPLVMLFDSR